jgi:colanic acid/amylovoran biosynthesis glycosyltransferase
MTATDQASRPAVLYIASRLPELSETFVYRELFGLRMRGRRVLGASVRAPRSDVGDEPMAALAREVTVAYSARTVAALPLAFLSNPAAFARIFVDAARADHGTLKSRVKHVVQATMGLGLGWRSRKQGITHVHAHMAHVPAMVGVYAARALGARFSFTGHAADLFVQRSALRFKLDRADFVSSISNWHQRFYREIGAAPMVGMPLIRCSVAVPNEIYARGSDIVAVARLVRKKGIDLLISAFATAALPGWRLRIIGDGPERASLERQAAALGLGDLVTFEGARPHAWCLKAIAGSGMFVLPCRTAENGDQDGIPVVLMEAMAAARPVIAGDLPTLSELIRHGETGLRVDPSRSEELVAAIRRIAADAEYAQLLGANAREFVAQEFSDEVNLDRLCAALDSAAAHG